MASFARVLSTQHLETLPASEHYYCLFTDEEEVDINARYQMFQFISNDNGPDGIPYAAAAGDATTLGQQLDKFPDEV